MARKLNDVEVAQFITNFMDRSTEDQQASPVWQSLLEWEETRISERTGKLVPEKPATLMSQAKKPGPAPSTITSKDLERKPAPEPKPPDAEGCFAWNGRNIPKAGRVFVNDPQGQTPPPGEGWKRKDSGWFRTA